MKFIEYIQTGTGIGDDHIINSSFDWLFWSLILFNLIAFAYVRTLQSGYITVLFRTGIYNRQLYQNTQEDLRLSSAGSVLLTIAFFNSAAILVSAFISPDSQQIWIVLIAIIGVILLKYITIKALSIVSETIEGLTEHWSNHLIYYQIQTLILTPILCFTHFMNSEIKAVMAILLSVLVIGIILLRELQSFIRAIRQRISIVYIILYLCTLELIPLIVLIRVLVR